MNTSCTHCGGLNDVGDNRVYVCPCGYVKDRDTNAASNILNEGLKKCRKDHPIRCVEDVKLLDLGLEGDAGKAVSLNLSLKNKKPSQH